MAARRTAKQKAASRKNLEKARAARSKRAGAAPQKAAAKKAVAKAAAKKPVGNTFSKAQKAAAKSATADWKKKQESLSPATLKSKWTRSLTQLGAAKSDAAIAEISKKTDFWEKAYHKAVSREAAKSLRGRRVKR